MTRVPIEEIEAATARLVADAARLDEAAVRGPSLLPGWTRGHVLTHVARNADGGTRLLVWARTGQESHEYASAEARAAEIEAGAGRAPAELVADVRASATRFADACRAMPGDRWDVPVRWTGGAEHPVRRATDARLTEVLLHHVDLDAGFGPADWPGAFVADQLARTLASYARRPGVPRVRVHATDTGLRLGDEGGLVEGTQADLLAWLTGRADGIRLAGHLPAFPPLF
ncbi:maleylpyruvate isomerase family mycothiol-dependent enzyme [Actinomadura parmotrematis]|uniref:Maleylpyruvate isomerase family mycothiol-dependent enzyme n=1 Tax=Actinomadura parmotrematis TaxID=2864039 RepID=A0ABS7G010_9ACTN|nr:maleylpyruvate isomerase family mycothiol-dependent enzyme [Actinomadura parmotrematis]MBW8485896.1 maleylpyruvate isomerase family mycothiol-dependent enzyme [Actinomadura parmotrematis]